MGQCSSNNNVDTLKSRDIHDKNLKDFQEEGSKLVLLGPGDSGKSTFMKQLVSIFGEGHNPKDFTQIVYKNVLVNMEKLVTACEDLSRSQPEFALGDVSTDVDIIKRNCDGISREGIVMTKEIASAVKNLWEDEGIQSLLSTQRSKVQMLDSAPHFFDKIDEIASEMYEPSLQDIVLSRVRTTGIHECSFVLDGRKFSVVDVGGQRSERKKWVHLFEDCTGLIFFSAISEYDQYLFEDETTNRCEEAIKLFQEISNSRWFRSTPIVLFLNKKDLLQEKIENVAVKDYFPEYEHSLEDQTYENCVNFFKNKFESQNRDPRREIYTHVTCCIDNSTKKLFHCVADIITKDMAHKML